MGNAREQIMMLTQLARDYMNGRRKMGNYNNNYSLALGQLYDEDRAREEKKKEEEEGSRITRAHSVFVKGAEKKDNAREQIMMLTQLARDYMNGRQKMENYNNNYSLALVQLADEDRTREEKKKEEEEDSRITRAHSVFVKGAEKKERACIARAHLEVEMKSWESACIARALMQKKLRVQSREHAPKGERALKQRKLRLQSREHAPKGERALKQRKFRVQSREHAPKGERALKQRKFRLQSR